MGAIPGFPALNAMPGCTFTCTFIPRPDMPNSAFSLWNENFFLGINVYAHLARAVINIDEKRLRVLPTRKIYVSQVKLGLYPTIEDFESCLLIACAYELRRSNPDWHLLPHPANQSNKTLSPNIAIIERRLHIGLHNTHVFVSPPIITNLQKFQETSNEDAKSHRKSRASSRRSSRSICEDKWFVDELRFPGRLEIPQVPLEYDNNIALVFMVEYKLQMTIVKKTRNHSVDTKKDAERGIHEILEGKARIGEIEPKPVGGLTGILEKLGGKKKDQEESEVVEKSVCIGWSWWVPPKVDEVGTHLLPLETKIGSNPHLTWIYQPTHAIAKSVFSKVDNVHYQNPRKGKMDKESSYSDKTQSSDSDSNDSSRRGRSRNRKKRNNEILTKKLKRINLDEDYLSSKKHPIILSFTCEGSNQSRPSSPEHIPEVEKIVLSEPPADIKQNTQSTMTVPPIEIVENEDLGKIENTDTSKQSSFSTLEAKEFMEASRMEKSRIMSAGFPERRIVCSEKEFKSKSDSSTGPSDYINGWRDFEINFMSITFNGLLVNQLLGQTPKSVFFSFQFYHFGYTTTAPASIYTGPLPVTAAHNSFHRRSLSSPQRSPSPHKRTATNIMALRRHLASDEENEFGDMIWPGILFYHDKVGTPKYSHPGIQSRFLIDPAHNPAPISPSDPPVPATIPILTNPLCPIPDKLKDMGSLNKYLNCSNLVIDIWDTESLMLVGVATFPLNTLTGISNHIEWEGDVAVAPANHIEDDLEADSQSIHSRIPTASPMTSNFTDITSKSPLAKIHIRISNSSVSDPSVSTLSYSQQSQSPTGFSPIQRKFGTPRTQYIRSRRQKSPVIVSDFRNTYWRRKSENISNAARVFDDETI
ncbi:hypothetical protein HK096_004410, partial [Nowakowskiella sp. JEL0078]